MHISCRSCLSLGSRRFPPSFLPILHPSSFLSLSLFFSLARSFHFARSRYPAAISDFVVQISLPSYLILKHLSSLLPLSSVCSLREKERKRRASRWRISIPQDQRSSLSRMSKGGNVVIYLTDIECFRKKKRCRWADLRFSFFSFSLDAAEKYTTIKYRATWPLPLTLERKREKHCTKEG